MSADNGIYILKSPKGNSFEFRVIHAQAIENINYDPDESGFNIEALKTYFGRAQVFSDEDKAAKEACSMADAVVGDTFCPILEYGISYISIPFKFPQQSMKPTSEAMKAEFKRVINDTTLPEWVVTGIRKIVNSTFSHSCHEDDLMSIVVEFVAVFEKLQPKE